IARRIRYHIKLAQQMISRIDEDPDFERLAPVPFSTICFRARPSKFAPLISNHKHLNYLDYLNEKLVNSVNESGEMFLSHTRVNDQYAIRMAIGNIRTELSHIDRAWKVLKSHLVKVCQDFPPESVRVG